jgi:hypothetical protein
MFRPLKFVFKTVILVKLLAVAFAAGMGVAYIQQIRAQYRTWGLVKGDDERGLAGDELVAEPDLIETRVIDIDAPPEEVWKWIAQLGYGRGGWYSFAAIDRPWSPGGGPQADSADVILEEFQDLAEGDFVPTHPRGGFEAKVVEPGETLVLFLDDTMFREQMGELAADVADAAEERGGSFELDLDTEMPPYRVSWAFVLEDAPGGRTRLIERLRASIDASQNQWRAKPALKMGVFVLLRSQLEGIKRRAEGVEEA